MKRSKWNALIKNNNGRHIGNISVLEYPVYAIKDDMGYHKNKYTLPAYVCEITEEDVDLVDDNNISKIVYPAYICIPSKIVYGKESMPKLDIQILGILALDSSIFGTTAPCAETTALLEAWTRYYNREESLELMIHRYLMKLNE